MTQKTRVSLKIIVLACLLTVWGKMAFERWELYKLDKVSRLQSHMYVENDKSSLPDGDSIVIGGTEK